MKSTKQGDSGYDAIVSSKVVAMRRSTARSCCAERTGTRTRRMRWRSSSLTNSGWSNFLPLSEKALDGREGPVSRDRGRPGTA